MIEELSKAIGARLLIKITYKGISYIVEPHLLGRNMAKKDCVLGWITNSTNKGQEGKWKTFLFDEIAQLELMEDRFIKPRPGYDPYESTMTRIYYRL